MKEEFLHFIWKYGLYDHGKLLDNEGNLITVLHPGEYNRDSGPDFFNARIISGGTIWAGNIEIHTLSSHFDIHGHQHDPMFDNIILHVVAKNDRKIFNSRGEEILTTELCFEEAIYDKYLSLVNNPFAIACHEELASYSPVLLRNWIDALIIERIEAKSEHIESLLVKTGL